MRNRSSLWRHTRQSIPLGVLIGPLFLFWMFVALPARAADANLIANASAETASSKAGLPLAWLKGGFGSNNRSLTYPVAGIDGAKAMKTEIASYTDGDAKWYFQPVSVSGGQTLAFSDWYTSSATTVVTIQYQLQDGTYRYPVLFAGLPPASNWTQAAKTFTVPKNYGSPVVNVSIFHAIKSVGWVVTDNYRLQTVDTISPTVTLAPVSPQPATGVIVLSATASDDVGVTGVQLYVDGLKTGNEIGSAPYAFAWDTGGEDDGLHSVFVVAHDAAMNSATSTPIQVETRNHAGGTLIVQVSVINDDGGVKTAAEFPTFIDAANVVSGAPNSVEAGTHVVSEITDAGYASTVTGDCASDGSVSVAMDAVKQCTIVNDDIAPLLTPAANLIANPSVESASSVPGVPVGWLKGGSGANTRLLTYPVAGFDGAKAIRTEITGYTNGDAKWYFQPVAVTGGQSYTFSDAYTSNVESSLTVQYRLQDGTYKYADIALHLPAASVWTELSRTFTVPTSYAAPVAALTVFHLIKSVGWIATDAHRLVQYVPPPVDPDNLVVNASFETPAAGASGLPAFWFRTASPGTQAGFAYPVSGQSGAAAAQVNVTSYVSGSGAKWYFQPVPVTPGASYEFSDEYKATAPSLVTLQFLFDDGHYDYLDLLDLASADGWTKAADRFVVPAHAVSMTAIHLIKSVGTLTTDSFSLKKLPDGRFDAGMISLDFDDGLTSVYQNAVPLLDAAGIRSTQYIITGSFGLSGNVDQSQTAAMRSAGHEIGSHTRTHAHLTQLAPAEVTSEVAGARSDLAALGMDPSTFAYPYGEFNNAVEQAVVVAGYRGARSVRQGFNSRNTNPFELEDQHVESNTTIDQIKGWIDQALADRTWLILELHDIDHSGLQYSTTPEILAQILAYIQSTGIRVVTNAEGLTAMGH